MSHNKTIFQESTDGYMRRHPFQSVIQHSTHITHINVLYIQVYVYHGIITNKTDYI